ncbi:hypothetical protein JB92DRAFT_2702378 [Gautieria morchelliformis]|nr:hypothetical protein JB92DRAFT_2702378 [Gautieria morchelliformis]
MQLGFPVSRHTIASIAPNKRRFHVGPVNLAHRKLSDDDIDSSAPIQDRQPWSKGRAVLYASGVGIASASLYYILVNGPSRSAPTSATAPLAPTHFTPVTLTASISCTPYTKLLTFKLPSHLIPDASTRMPIFSVYVKDSDIQVERPYTPLEGIDAQGQMHFWVKRYQGGEVGRWLHERKVGDEIEIRGPIPNWKWQDGEWDEIVMVSGGTGITPFYQLMNGVFSAISEGRLPRTRFTLLHSSPTPLDLPPRSILGPLQLFAQLYPESISIRLYVDAMDPKASRVDLPRLALGRIGRKALERAVAPRSAETDWWWTKLWGPTRRADVARRKILFLVCGPEPMIGAIAGPRVQAAHGAVVGGVLGEMGAEPHQVCKL